MFSKWSNIVDTKEIFNIIYSEYTCFLVKWTVQGDLSILHSTIFVILFKKIVYDCMNINNALWYTSNCATHEKHMKNMNLIYEKHMFSHVFHIFEQIFFFFMCSTIACVWLMLYDSHKLDSINYSTHESL